MTKRKKGCLFFLAISLMAGAIIAWFQWPNRKIEIARETTYYTEPLLADGRVDYITAINNKFSVGVNNENNALIPLLQVFDIAEETSPEYADNLLRELGLGTVKPKYKLVDCENLLDKLYPLTDETEIENRRIQFEQACRPWKTNERPLWAEALEQQSAALDIVVEASKRPRYFVPLFAGNLDEESFLAATLIPISGTLRTAARNLNIRAMSRLGDGNIEGAIEDIQTIRRISRLLDQSPTLIDHLIALPISGIAFCAEEQLVPSDGMTDKQRRSYGEFLGEPQPNRVSLAQRFSISERCMLLDTILHGHRYGFGSLASGMMPIPDGSPLGPATFAILGNSADINVALREVNRLFDETITQFDASVPRQRIANAENWESSILELERRFDRVQTIGQGVFGGPVVRGNLLGQFIFLVMAPHVPQLLGISVKYEMEDTLIHLAFSIELFRRNTGQYPESLTELQPNYITEIPQDWFSDGHVTYRRTDTGFVVYSVGENKIDDGGLDSDEMPGNRRGDIRVRVGEIEK